MSPQIPREELIRALAAAQENNRYLRELLLDARGYITPTISTHEEISDVLGWCDCGYCTHVPKEPPPVPTPNES